MNDEHNEYLIVGDTNDKIKVYSFLTGQMIDNANYAGSE